TEWRKALWNRPERASVFVSNLSSRSEIVWIDEISLKATIGVTGFREPSRTRNMPTTTDARLRRLRLIYSEMRRWSRDPMSVVRVLGAVNPDAKLAIIGEAAGPRTLRVSGVNYFDPHGRLGATGRYLDQVLRSVGYTVYPPRTVKVPEGVVTRPL